MAYSAYVETPDRNYYHSDEVLLAGNHSLVIYRLADAQAGIPPGRVIVPDMCRGGGPPHGSRRRQSGQPV